MLQANTLIATKIFMEQQYNALARAQGDDSTSAIFKVVDHSYSVRKLTRQMVLMDEFIRERCMRDIELPRLLQITALLHDVGYLRQDMYLHTTDTEPLGKDDPHDKFDHQRIGFEIAREGGIIDQRILFAIRYHEVRSNRALEEIFSSADFKSKYGIVDKDGIMFFLRILRDANRIDAIGKYIYEAMFAQYKSADSTKTENDKQPFNCDERIMESFLNGEVIERRYWTALERLLEFTSLIYDINHKGALRIILTEYDYRNFFVTTLRKIFTENGVRVDNALFERLENAFYRNIIDKIAL